MTTNDQDKPSENEPSSNPEDRIEQIKKEAEEDASSYYAQGKSEGTESPEEEFKKELPKVNEGKEEMSLLKAIAFLGFGMAALAIIFILFFIRDLGNRVGGMDSEVKTLAEQYAPLKKQITDEFAKVNDDVSQLKSKFGSFEKQAAITELKRAMVAIQGVTAGNPEVQAKTDQVIASINALLKDLSGVEAMATPQLTAPAAAAPVVAPAHVEEAPVVEMIAEIEPEPAEEEAPAEEESTPVGEISLQSESAESDDDSGDDESSDDEEEEEE